MGASLSSRRTKRLADYASGAMTPSFDVSPAKAVLSGLGEHGISLIALLEQKNGFYAFESALHVFPFAPQNDCASQEVMRWNTYSTWKHAYPDVVRGTFCFAEDLFGYQYCIFKGEISRFDPETGFIETVCRTFEEWAELIATDTDFQTGYPLALAWKAKRGLLQAGKRLLPIYPFTTKQGAYELSHLYAGDALEGMLSRAEFARQISKLPDGGQVRFVPKNIPRS